MSKYIVETYYTCSFKIVHKLDELNEKKLSELENRKDGDFKIIDIKLNNRKTKKIDNNENSRKATSNLEKENTSSISSVVSDKIVHSNKSPTLDDLNKKNVVTSNCRDLCLWD